jgi:hypothetical protein
MGWLLVRVAAVQAVSFRLLRCVVIFWLVLRPEREREGAGAQGRASFYLEKWRSNDVLTGTMVRPRLLSRHARGQPNAGHVGRAIDRPCYETCYNKLFLLNKV